MLWLIDIVGGGILMALIASRVAQRDASDKARRMRLCAGSLGLGLAVGILLLWLFPGALTRFFDPYLKFWVALLAIPVLLMILTFFFESVRKKFQP